VLLWGAVLLVGVSLLSLVPPVQLPYRLGQYVPRDITSRVDFRVLSVEQLSEAEREARATSPAVFRANADLWEEIAAEIRSLPEQLKAATRPANLDEELRRRYGVDGPEALAAWQGLSEAEDDANSLPALLGRLRASLLEVPLVRAADTQEQRTAVRVVLLAGDTSREAVRADLVSLENAPRRAEAVERVLRVLSEPLRPAVRAILQRQFEQGRPAYEYDSTETQRRIYAAVEQIRRDPPQRCFVRYKSGDILVSRSRRGGGAVAPLSNMDLQRLRVEQAHYLREQSRQRPWAFWLRLLGRAVLLMVVVALMMGYIVLYEPRIVHNALRSFSVVAVVLLTLAVVKVLQRGGANPYVSALPILLAGLIFTIVYGRRLALGLSGVLALLAVLQMRQDLDVLVVLAAGLAGSIALLDEIRTRTKVVRVAAAGGLVVMACVWAHALARDVPWRFALANSLWGGGAALLAGFLIQGLLPAIERIFGVATSMTLLEWCDASRPLLQRLRMEAPGTYSHALQLGSMCEAAAERIGARGLLVRVGCYYHDIGKIKKADYFVENQASSDSRHSKLSPAMSLLVITGHVKDGLEMAREYGLPRILHEFIATHHGTTLVQYFYKAATERRKSDADRAPDEVEFRYPGPKPQSREAAILMLADACESSVRAMSERTPGRIENQVHAMVMRRLMDGQLDECELTLAEVHDVEESLVKSLCAIYHTRVAYPTPKGEKPSAAETPAQPAPEPAPVQPAGTARAASAGSDASEDPARQRDRVEEAADE
jgi:hypothetical protein